MQKLEEIKKLSADYEGCKTCTKLCEHRTKIVFGSGKLSADLMIIGDAPDRKEDAVGRPLVGNSGEILDAALYAAGMKRTPSQSDVYLTNAVMCRPATLEEGRDGPWLKNREPTPAEQESCRARLLREIYIIDPKVILLLGNIASTLVTRRTMSNCVGNMYYLKVPGVTEKTVIEYPTVVTWHPAYILNGSQQMSKGKPKSQFHDHVAFAARLVEKSKQLYQEVEQW